MRLPRPGLARRARWRIHLVRPRTRPGRAARSPFVACHCSGAGGPAATHRLEWGAPAGADELRLVLCAAPKGALSSKAAYAVSTMGRVPATNADFLWGCRAPSQVCFFAWLLTLARVHTRDVLLRKTIVEASTAVWPVCPVALEMADRLIFGCPFARSFWDSLRLPTTGATIRELHLFDVSAAMATASLSAFVLLSCWHLWKRRNAVVFREATPSLELTLKTCRDGDVLWRGRFKLEHRVHIDVWMAALTRRPLELLMCGVSL